MEVHRDKPFRMQRAGACREGRSSTGPILRPSTSSAAGNLHTIRAAIISPMSMQTIGNQPCAAKEGLGDPNLAHLGASGMLPEKLSPRCVSSELDVARQRDIVDWATACPISKVSHLRNVTEGRRYRETCPRRGRDDAAAIAL